VADIHTASDISCLCSYTEGLPNAVVEAMACGLPCVVTDVGDSARVVGDTGLVVPPRDPVALADALRGLLTESGDARRDRGRRARERVENEFTIERMSTHYLNLYRELTN
jgi:glycosyltransferase involved in cell wall biosynthesis